MTGSLIVARRFCGPLDSGNGGYVCGLIAGFVEGPAEVAPRLPQPLGSGANTAHHGVRRPWTWVFEGCSCERDLAAVIHAAGFASVKIDPYRIRSPFLPANTQIAGTAIA